MGGLIDRDVDDRDLDTEGAETSSHTNDAVQAVKQAGMTGVILAGGQNRRMNGQVKALLPFGKDTLLERQLREMRTICREVLIVTVYPHVFAPLIAEDDGVRTVSDIIPSKGPLSGIHAAFSFARHRDVWVVACDMPFISAVAAQAMQEVKVRENYDAVIPLIDGKRHPLHGVYGRSAAEIVAQLLHGGKRRVKDLLSQLNWKAADETFFYEYDVGPRFVTNINTPEQYDAAKLLAEQLSHGTRYR
ncbi:molybdenum cofactor guanylyltransferase [Numidum massiliense]|uniref:molybdenum cofactor guanylyltransferase n=1 Tax=Numidum massiliense TaxID=1522315 RepID=UPI0006D541DF|nr:molybdenum cofactor guanylyltransferase [Numidum massiliense]